LKGNTLRKLFVRTLIEFELLKLKQLLKEQQQPANNCCSSNPEFSLELPNVDVLKTSTDAVKVSDSGLVLREDDTKHSISSSSTTAVALWSLGELPSFASARFQVDAVSKGFGLEFTFKRR
jgi:hypothetical protein